MRDLVLTLFIFGALPYVLMRPHIGLYIWSWLGYMNPHRLAYGFAYTMPFTAIVAGFTLIAMVFSKEKKTFPVSGITIFWILFVLWTLVTYMFAINPTGADIELSRLIKIQVMILCTLLLINNKEKLIHLVWVIAFSIGFYGIKGGVFAIITGFNYRVHGPEKSFIGANNELALALLMIIPLFYFLFTVTANKYLRWMLLAVIFLCFFSVIASYSRGAFLGMAVMLFFLWLGTKRKVLTVGIVVAVITAGLPFIPEKWFDRMNTIETYEQDESANQRLNSWGFAINLANDRPIVGGGFRAFSLSAFQKYGPDPNVVFDAHSIYFEVLGEQGYVGLFLFLMIWILVMTRAQKIKKQAKKVDELRWMVDLSTMVQVSLIAYMVSGAFLGLAYFDLPYHLMTLVVITDVLYRKYLQDEAENAAR